MIEWVYMLASMLFFGLVNFRRKIITKGIALREAIFWESLGFIPIIAFVFLTMQIPLTTDFLGICVVSAVLGAVATALFYLALRYGYVSAASTVTNLNTHVGAFLAFFVFSEAFSPRLIVGILLAALVVVLLSKSKTIKPGKWMLFALLSMVCFALKGMADKWLSISYDPLASLSIVLLFTSAMYVIPFALAKRRATLKRKASLIGNGVILAAAVIGMFFAFNAVPLSIAFPVIGMNILVTVLLGAHFLKERLDRRAWLAVALAAFSIWLLAG